MKKTVSFNVQPLEEIHFNSRDVSDETQSEGGGSEGMEKGVVGKYPASCAFDGVEYIIVQF